MMLRKKGILFPLIMLAVMFVCVWTTQAANTYPVEKRTITVGVAVNALPGVAVRNGEKAPAWVSSNKKIIAKKKGTFVALKPGKCTLTLKSSKKTYYKINFTVKKQKVETSKITLFVGSKAPGVFPLPMMGNSNFAEQPKWVSSNKKVATINKKGLVTPKKKGTCTFTYKSSYCTYMVYKVTVKRLPEKAKINKNSLALKIGDTYQLKLKISPGSADYSRITWKSSNTKVAKVSQKGLVTAVSQGRADIHAEVTLNYNDGTWKRSIKTFAEVCSVEVWPAITGVKLENTSVSFSLNVRDPEALIVEYDDVPYKDYAAIKEVLPKGKKLGEISYSFSSSNKNVATVDEEGKITPVGPGKTDITVTVKNRVSKAAATETITVYDMSKFYKVVPIDKTDLMNYLGIAERDYNTYNGFGEITRTDTYLTLTNKLFKDGWYYYGIDDFRVSWVWSMPIGNDEEFSNPPEERTELLEANHFDNSYGTVRVQNAKGSLIFLKKDAVVKVVNRTQKVGTENVTYKEVQLIDGGRILRFNTEDAFIRKTDRVF